jgi:hypothetical protein
MNDGSHPEEMHNWLQGVVGDALREAIDEIAREYLKLRSTIASVPTLGEVIRSVEDRPKAKGGA